MANDNIIQFVGFITDLDTDVFLEEWEYYSKECITVPGTTLLQQEIKANSRFKYLSQHRLKEAGLMFAFAKGRNSRNLKAHRIKIVQVGGYIAQKLVSKCTNDDFDIKIMVFINHHVSDIDQYLRLFPRNQLNVYQEYYENCLYSHILEFFSIEKDVPDFLLKLKTMAGNEAITYRESVTAKI
jgi:hypothetical protein